QAAIHATWNFMEGIAAKGASTTNPYHYMDDAVAKKTVDSLLTASGKYTAQLTTKRPNIILIVWESFTEKAIHFSIEGQSVTPHFNQLKQEGLYFSHVYASGDRTDKGLPAILSGYPAMNNTSVIRIPNKIRKLTLLS